MRETTNRLTTKTHQKIVLADDNIVSFYICNRKICGTAWQIRYWVLYYIKKL